MNWRTETVLACLAVGLVVGVALGAVIAPRLELSKTAGKFNVAVAIVGGCVGLAGLIAAIAVNV